MEILSAEIKSNISHTFTFSDKVDKFIIGFSKILIEYPSTDHHLKRILYDVSNIQVNDREIVVTPKLRLNDASGNSESFDSIITVVIFATLGYKNTSVDMLTNVKTNVERILPLCNPVFYKSALSSSGVEYPDDDHHLNKYNSKIEFCLLDGSFTLKGQSTIQDRHEVSGTGEVYGSSIIYNGNDHRIMCADFDSEKVGNSGTVSFGKKHKKIHLQDYQLGCFISSFSLSFKSSEDHHVKQIEVSAELEEQNLIDQDGHLLAKINLKAFLTDNGKHHSDIPNNSVSGFILAINKKMTQ